MATRLLLDSINLYDTSSRHEHSILQLDFDLAIADKDESAYGHFLALPNDTTNDLLRNENEYAMGSYFLESNKFVKAITHFEKVDPVSDLVAKVQRDLIVSKYLKDNALRFQLPESSVTKRYDAMRSSYEELGLEIVSLIFTHETSFTLQRLGEIQKQIEEKLLLIQEYRQLIENEKNRIYQLSQQ